MRNLSSPRHRSCFFLLTSKTMMDRQILLHSIAPIATKNREVLISSHTFFYKIFEKKTNAIW
jgi:hypothetical protein